MPGAGPEGLRATVTSGLRRLAIYPFEVAVAILLFVSGLTGLLGFGLADPVGVLLPGWLASALNSMTVLTGALMIVGTTTAERRAEITGLIFLTGVVACRFILYGVYLGFGPDFVQTGIFYTAIIWAAMIRLNTVRQGQTIVRIRNGRHL